jgi:N-acetylglucosaminyldiphosphoundecaprenol N-acetyl-beta-D-mannosaminyltransferase
MIASRRPHYIVTANVDFLVQARADVELHRILNDADLVLCDGQPLVWASRWLGRALPERVAGSDLVPELIRLAAAKGQRIFFLGGTPESAFQAVSNTQASYPDLKICGSYSPPFDPLLDMDHEYIVQKIRAAKPDLLFVSLGCPKAEKWMFMHYRSLGVPVAIGVGGTIDFLARRLKRAPRWMQRTGAEWLFRLIQEPRRLSSRYARDAREFGCAIVEQLWHFQWRVARPAQSAPASVDLVEPTWQRIRAPETLVNSSIQRDHQVWSRALGRHCLLELSHVRSVDSSGIGLLIELQRQLSRQEHFLILLAPSRAVRRALRLVRLEHIVMVARDTVEARQLISATLRQKLRIPASSAHATLPLLWQGEITAGTADHVWTVAQAQIDSFAEYAEPITVDLSGVPFIDSTGVALLLRAQEYASSKAAALRFVDPPATVRNVLRMSRLESAVVSVPPPDGPKLAHETSQWLEWLRDQWPSLKQRRVGGI